MKNSEITAVVLAGGRSLRLGMDKAQLKLTGDMTLLENAVCRVQRLSAEVVVVSDEITDIAGARCVRDVLPKGGPLGGIYSGLLAAHFPYCLVVACDMPFLNHNLLCYMVERSRDYDALVPRLGEREFGLELHPLHAIYARRCLSAIEQVCASGSRVIRDIYPMLKTVYLERGEIVPLDCDGLSFFNINTLQDLAQAKALLRERPDL